MNYVNRYFFSTSEDLGGIFDEIMSEVSNEAFYATAESTGGQQSAVIYEDKIGEYMEVKDVKGVLWDGALYNATYNKESGQCTLQLANGETNPKHPITAKMSTSAK